MPSRTIWIAEVVGDVPALCTDFQKLQRKAAGEVTSQAPALWGQGRIRFFSGDYRAIFDPDVQLISDFQARLGNKIRRQSHDEIAYPISSISAFGNPAFAFVCGGQASSS